MALDTVNKIKEAEKNSIEAEALARKQADEYIKAAEKNVRAQAESELSAAESQRAEKLKAAKKQAEAVLEAAKKQAQADTKKLFGVCGAREDEAIKKIIEKIV